MDEDRCWYRYHHLFADLLRQRLRQTQSEQFPILHDRASEWFEQNGLADYAIEHALRAKNFERAADLIEEFADHISQLGEHTKLRRWLDGLPVDMIFSRPHLCILDAEHLLTNGQIDKADIVLQAAEQSLESYTSFESITPLDEPNQQLVGGRKKLQGRAALVRAHLVHFKGDAEGALKYARLALEYLPESDSTWRSTAFDCIGNAYSWLGDVVSAYQSRSEAFEASKAVGNIYMILFSSLKLVVTLRDMGCLQQAFEICHHQLKIANESGLSQTAVVGWLYTLWGEVLAEKNELDRAIQLALKGVKLTEQGKDVTFLGSSYLCLMRVLFSRGDMDHANEIIQEVDDLTLKQNLYPWIMNQMAAWQARIWLAQDKLDSTTHWVRDLELDFDGALSPQHDFDYVVLARILIAQERLDETSKLLQRLFENAETGGRTSKMIEILILQALALQAQGDTEQAITKLEKTLTLAKPGGFIRIFVDEGPPMEALLKKMKVEDGKMKEYIRKLLAAFSDKEIHPSSLSPQPLIEPLSEREIEVLQLIAEGLTNQEIATKLYLSLNTVKVHTRNINGKLAVSSRTKAVARARTLGILPST